MTPTEALHIIRHPEDYCAASRLEARTIIADGYEVALEQVKTLQSRLIGAANYIDTLGGISKIYRFSLAATEPKE